MCTAHQQRYRRKREAALNEKECLKLPVELPSADLLLCDENPPFYSNNASSAATKPQRSERYDGISSPASLRFRPRTILPLAFHRVQRPSRYHFRRSASHGAVSRQRHEERVLTK